MPDLRITNSRATKYCASFTADAKFVRFGESLLIRLQAPEEIRTFALGTPLFNEPLSY